MLFTSTFAKTAVFLTLSILASAGSASRINRRSPYGLETVESRNTHLRARGLHNIAPPNANFDQVKAHQLRRRAPIFGSSKPAGFVKQKDYSRATDRELHITKEYHQGRAEEKKDLGPAGHAKLKKHNDKIKLINEHLNITRVLAGKEKLPISDGVV